MLLQAILKHLFMERSTMPSRVVGFVAAAALLASVGIANAADARANAKGPVNLTDVQLDNVTAGGNPALAAGVATAGALNFAGAINTAVAANLTAAANPLAVGTAVAADLGTAAAFNNLLATSTAAAAIAITP
jgi:hypothetical protein